LKTNIKIDFFSLYGKNDFAGYRSKNNFVGPSK